MKDTTGIVMSTGRACERILAAIDGGQDEAD
jgi:hypothetical protein